MTSTVNRLRCAIRNIGRRNIGRQNIGRLEEGFELAVQLAQRSRRLLAEEEEPDAMAFTYSLAQIYMDMDATVALEALYLPLIATGKRIRGEEHDYTRSTMDNLARLYEKQQGWDSARGIRTQVKELRKQVRKAKSAQSAGRSSKPPGSRVRRVCSAAIK